MTKAVIVSIEGSDCFLLNGMKIPRTYEAIGVNLLDGAKGVKIIPCQREGTPIQDTIHFDEFEIDGTVPDSQEECISLLNEIVFKKGGGNGNGVVNMLAFGSLQRFKGLNNNDQTLWQAGDIGCGFLLDGRFIAFGYYVGPDCEDGDALLQDENNWNTGLIDAFVNQ